MKTDKIIILGAGPAGLGCAYALKAEGIESIIYDRRASWGGLCNNFNVDGFRFDQFIHLSFSKHDYVNDIFLKQEHYKHTPVAQNYYKGHWLKHPAQNNLFHLSDDEKQKIIQGFKVRKNVPASELKNYKDWLYAQYGEYFSDNFALKYTKKYWTTGAENIETKWVGSRMYKPTLEEIEHSCYTENTPNTYYAKEMRYPKKGGYKVFMSEMAKTLNFQFNKEAFRIDLKTKTIVFSDGTSAQYDKLVSSIPLPVYAKIIEDMPADIVEACEKLAWTEGVLVSIGFNKPDIAKHLWFYIYDEDILVSRVHSPSLKSPDNVPSGCSSIQAEIFFSKKYKPRDMSLEVIKQKTVEDLSRIMGFDIDKDVAVVDVRCEPYANVIFDHDIYTNRKIIKDYLKQNDIIPIGRFGEWAYLWSDQSLLSGVGAGSKIAC